ncbi:hypothetical protein DH2020_012156 [Rehmannia glutinosa]|uniref:Uncharacterized protein n=1 Tax=Rehmannia glutinosa TaxID=99300 RepID=A0ABR0XFE6_REHGL
METKKISHTLNPLILFAIIISLNTYSFYSLSPVLDLDGNHLQTNTNYHILPLPAAAANDGGGLALSVKDPRRPCAPNVLQENDKTSVGLSLRFFPARDKKQFHQHIINSSVDLNIVFMAATVCVQRTVWRVAGPDWATRRRYVRSDGVLGRPGAETVGNWFKIEEVDNGEIKGYKIVYCPSVCGNCRVECGEVGVFVENGRRWLGLGGELPLVIVFKKV